MAKGREIGRQTERERECRVFDGCKACLGGPGFRTVRPTGQKRVWGPAVAAMSASRGGRTVAIENEGREKLLHSKN